MFLPPLRKVVAELVLECEAERYPSSLSEVPIEILERSDALRDEALARFGVGATTAEVNAWLNDRQSVVMQIGC